MRRGAAGGREISVLSLQLCCEPKTAPKNILKKKKRFHLFQPRISIMNILFLCSPVEFGPVENPSGRGGHGRKSRIHAGLRVQRQLPKCVRATARAGSRPLGVLETKPAR